MLRVRDWARNLAYSTDRCRIQTVVQQYHSKLPYLLLLVQKLSDHESCGKFCLSINEMNYITGINSKTIRRLLHACEDLQYIRKTGEFGGVSFQIPEYEFVYDEQSDRPIQQPLRLIQGLG